MKIFRMSTNTWWVYATQEEEETFNGVSFAKYLKENGWNKFDIATEMAKRFIYRCLLNMGVKPIGEYDFDESVIEWDDSIYSIIRGAFCKYVCQLFPDNEDNDDREEVDYHRKEMYYEEEVDGLTISLDIYDGGECIEFSIETKTN